MADPGEDLLTPNKKANDEDDKGIWAQILSDVSTRTSHKLPTNKGVLVLGNDGVGKTSLLKRLRAVDREFHNGYALEYTYIEVADDERDESTRLGVWIVAGDHEHRHLLEFAVTPKNVQNVLVMIVVDMSKPWTIIDSLHSWIQILREHIHSLNMTAMDLNAMEQRIVKQFQEYTDPEEAGDEKRRGTTTAGKEEEKVLLPLDDDVLTDNLGLPIVVVCTKTDSMGTLEKDMDYTDEHFDFIQQNIRRFCLKFGASLVYTSFKENKNMDLLYRYLVHLIYDFPFKSPALVVDKDSIFIPSGWDSKKKISILDEHLKMIHPDDAFDDQITKPHHKKPIADKEVYAEEEQSFLAKQMQLLQKNPPAPGSGSRPVESGIAKPTRTPGSPSSRIATRPAASTSPLAGKVKAEGVKGNGPGANPSEGVLANFFNSLLSKKSAGGPGAPSGGVGRAGGPGVEKSAVRSDAAAELDRMNRTKKHLGQSGIDAQGSPN